MLLGRAELARAQVARARLGRHEVGRLFFDRQPFDREDGRGQAFGDDDAFAGHSGGGRAGGVQRVAVGLRGAKLALRLFGYRFVLMLLGRFVLHGLCMIPAYGNSWS